jgi:hypothetical protein
MTWPLYCGEGILTEVVVGQQRQLIESRCENLEKRGERGNE